MSESQPVAPVPQAIVPVLVAVVLDRSGSMDAIADDAIGGFNAFLRQQKEGGGEVTFLLAQFDDVYELVHNGIPVADVPDLDRTTFVPRGGTALLDAMGRTICDVDARLAKMPTEPAVLIAIITDGEENRSREFSLARVNQMVTERRAKGWSILFLGATEAALQTARDAGVDASSSVAFAATGAGVRDAMDNVSKTSMRLSTGRSIAGAVVDLEKKLGGN